ncbi:hypothetical protein EI555_003790, partial [Monodon monoceros]
PLQRPLSPPVSTTPARTAPTPQPRARGGGSRWEEGGGGLVAPGSDLAGASRTLHPAAPTAAAPAGPRLGPAGLRSVGPPPSPPAPPAQPGPRTPGPAPPPAAARPPRIPGTSGADFYLYFLHSRRLVGRETPPRDRYLPRPGSARLPPSPPRPQTPEAAGGAPRGVAGQVPAGRTRPRLRRGDQRQVEGFGARRGRGRRQARQARGPPLSPPTPTREWAPPGETRPLPSCIAPPSSLVSEMWRPQQEGGNGPSRGARESQYCTPVDPGKSLEPGVAFPQPPPAPIHSLIHYSTNIFQCLPNCTVS